MAALTGEKISTASPISEGSRFRTGFDGPSCVYKPASGLGGVSAEFVSAESYDGLVSDPMLKLTPMAGVGDEAFQALDQIDGTTVIRTLAKKGDDHLLVMIFSGTSPENAKELTTKLLG